MNKKRRKKGVLGRRRGGGEGRLREWSSTTGGLQNRRRGVSEVVFLQRGGGVMGDGISFSHGEREWGTTCFEVVLTLELKVLAILKGWGRKTCYPVLGGGGQKMFWTCDFPIL